MGLRQSHRRTSRTSSRPLSGLTLLLVEDDADLRDMLADALGEAGAWVLTAQTAAEALRTATVFIPSCIVADLHLGADTGFRLLGAVRSAARPEVARVPVVAMTGRPEYVRPMEEAPFSERLLKPFAPEDVIAAVLRACATQAVTDRAREALGRRADIRRQGCGERLSTTAATMWSR